MVSRGHTDSEKGGKLMSRYFVLPVLMLMGSGLVGCGHPAAPPAASTSVPATASSAPVISPEARQNKQAFIAQMKQAQAQRSQAAPQKP